MRELQIPTIRPTDPPPEEHLPPVQTAEPSASGQLDFLVHQAMIVAGAAGAAIALETDGEIVCRARSGNAAPELGAVLDRESGISGQCISAGEAHVCSDTALDVRVNAAVCEALGVRSIIVLPLKRSGTVVGVLELFAREPGSLSPSTVRKLDPVVESIIGFIDDSSAAPARSFHTEAATPQRNELSSAEPSRILETFLTEIRADSRARSSRIAVAFLLGLVVVLFAVFVARAIIRPRTSAAPVATVPAMSPQDLRRAAELGDPSAQYALGLALQKGDGIKQDAASGARWLELAAKHGEANAQYEFANALMQGNGIGPDLVEACAWYTVAAFSGKPVSEAKLSSLGQKLGRQDMAKVRYRLGQMFSSGVGVPQDHVAAYAWYSLSEAAGYRPARSDKAALASEMSRQEISEAKKRAAEWLDSERSHEAASAQSR